jgi:Flp pilus assembly CpaE family ATPase
VASQLAALGLGDPLVAPFSVEQLESALLGSIRPAFQKQMGNLIAFIPSRPGSGATTIGLNTAYALANSFGRKVAFVELDEYAGIAGSLLPGEERDRSVEQNPCLNNYSWKRYVHSVHGVDILPGATSAALTAANRWAIKRLADIARAQYDSVIVQIPRVTDPRMRLLAHQLERICLVSNSDGTGLAMTRKRISELEALGVDTEKIDVALNRCSDNYFAEAFEKALARELLAVFPYEPKAILDAQAKSQGLVAAGSGFGKIIAVMASRLCGQVEIEEPKKRRFAFWSRPVAAQAYKVAS